MLVVKKQKYICKCIYTGDKKQIYIYVNVYIREIKKQSYIIFSIYMID